MLRSIKQPNVFKPERNFQYSTGSAFSKSIENYYNFNWTIRWFQQKSNARIEAKVVLKGSKCLEGKEWKNVEQVEGSTLKLYNDVNARMIWLWQQLNRN